MSDSKPSEVRTRAVDEYEVLRRTLDELDRLAMRLLAEENEAVDEALGAAARLFRELSAYIDLQELLILPSVRCVDIWGDIRADALARDHELRRTHLRAIQRAHRSQIDSRTLASDLQEFSRRLRADLEREESDVLGSHALRDDVVVVDPD